CAMILDLFDYW
nr:immunoglobulin heavy chain junction region [Macaca mulatta]MOX67095.1 immunoglobulin heavy chain junction region [Macaca mulatta]